MENYIIEIKDILVIIVPIIVAFISYKSNKKTHEDIRLEVEKISKEKEAETKMILEKIGAELESQKQLLSWQDSLPQTKEYTNLLNTERYGHIASLPKLCQDIYIFLDSHPSEKDVIELNKLLDRIELPEDGESLFPFEILIILNYKLMRNAVNSYIKKLV